MERGSSDGKEQSARDRVYMSSDLSDNEVVVLKDFLGVVRLALYVLAVVGGAGVSASHFGLI